MVQEFRGWTRPRPVRIAFLVEESEHSSLILDGIFADCYGRWGGRFSLVVPCQDNKVVPAYWPWLEKYGPDIVYSYVQLSDADILDVHERLAPSEYRFHRIPDEPRLDVFGFKPSYGISPLSSLASIFKLARYSTPGREGGPLKIIDRWHGEEPSRLLTDNFGTYLYSRGGSYFPHDARVAASLMTIVSPEHQQNRQLGVPADTTAIPTEIAAYDEFASRRASSLSVISAQFAPRLELYDHRWHDSLNVVLGETLSDRILFWNSRLLTPAWLDGDLGVIRVTSEALRNREFLDALGRVLKHRNHFGGGGHHHVTIRSISATLESIEEARVLIQSTKPWGSTNIEAIDSVTSFVPSSKVLQNANERYHGVTPFFSQPEWTEFNWTPPAVRPPSKSPDHLADVPPQHSFAEGYWCADFSLEYEGASSRFGNDSVWKLPKRWRMSRAFSHSLVGSSGPTGWSRDGWRGRDGHYSMYVCLTRPVEVIEPPTVLAAMRWAFVVDGLRPRDGAQVYPPSKVSEMRLSNEARYLTGLLGMTGGLTGAQKMLLHPFLTDIFASLGGSTKLPVEKVVPTANRLRKMVQFESPFDLRGDRERNVLASLIVKATGSLKKPIDHLSYDSLSKAWREYRENYWRQNPQVIADDPEEWDAHEQQTLDVCLIEMRERQILFQGHQWTCPHCHHKNWLDMSELAPKLICKICKKVEPAPIEIRWLFRPNEFVIQSLRDHSALSLIWTLTALQSRARLSFYYLEPMWLYFSDGKNEPDAEVDLLAVVDGETFVCEVKASWNFLRTKDITNLVDLAIRLRPDIALLAVMEGHTELDSELAAARAVLAEIGIKFELLTLQGHSIEHGSWLMS